MSGTLPPDTPVAAGEVWTVQQWNAFFAFVGMSGVDTSSMAAINAALATLTANGTSLTAAIAATNSIVGGLQTALIPMQAADATATTAIATLQSTVVTQGNALTAAQNAQATTQNTLTTTQAQVAAVQAQTTSLQASVNPAIATLQSTTTTQGNAISTNQAALATAQSNLAAAQAQVAGLQTLTTAQQSAITALQNAVAALQAIAAVPNAPTGLSTGTITSTTIVFNWIAPAAGPAPTGYVLQRSPAGTNTWTTANTIASTAVTVTTTPPGGVGVLYDWRVFATNASGSGPASSPPVTIGTLATVPTAPTGLGGVVIGANITFTWVAGAGGSAATGYTLQRSPTGANTFSTAATTVAPTVTITVTPPGAPGTIYDWQVLGTNGSGSGPVSTPLVTLGIPATVPTQPTGLATGTITSTTIVFNWVAGVGGTAATGYTLQRSPTGAGTWTTAATTTAPTVTATVTPPGGPGTGYDWQVFGTNAVGPGPVSSPPVTAATLPTVPAAPTGLAGVVVGANITFTWAAGVGGTAATGYTLQASPTGTNTWSTAGTTTAPTVVFTATPGGPPGTIYDWRVFGTNGAGSGPVSSPLVTLGIPATVPTKPTGLAVGVITTTTIAFSWTAGVGGTAATGYTLQRSPAGAGTWTTAATTTAPTTTVTVTPPGTAGTLYDWQVFGTNAVGPGPVSSPPITASTPPVVAGTRLASNIPFSSTSVWNIGIGSGATWGAGGNADVVKLRSLVLNFTDPSFCMPMYFGGPNDPLVNVSCSAGGQDGTWPFSVNMHVPIGATPATGSDHHMILFDSTQPNMAVSIFLCTLTNGFDVTGGITSGLGALLDLTKNGISRVAGDFQGTDDYLGGVITDYDLAQGAITHAVRIGISRDALRACNTVFGSSVGVPWPNYFEDYDGPGTYAFASNSTNGILAGSTFGIPASVNLAGLGLTTGGLMLATCLQKYGGFWRDSSGTNSVQFYTTPGGNAHPLIGQANSDASTILAVLNIMRNQSTDNGLTRVNGGGTYPTPLPAIGLPVQSPAFTTIPPATSITMATADVVTVVGGRVMLTPAGGGGTVPWGSTSSVVDTLIDASTPGNIYYASNDPSFAGQPNGLGWFLGTRATLTWGPSSDPRPGQLTQPSTLAILNFIKGMAGNHVIVGQYIDSINGHLELDNFTSLTGKHVAIIGDGYWPFWPNQYSANTGPVNATAIAQWNAGGLVYLNTPYPAPTNDPLGPFGAADILQCITSGTAQYNFLHGLYDQEIAGLLALQAAGVIVINRAFFENKWGFWWSIGGPATTNWTDARFITMWQQRDAYFKSKGVQNIVRVYSQGFNAGDGSGHNTYPGDAYVDLQGEDVYTYTATDYLALYNNERAQHPATPWIMAEWGSKDPNGGDPNFNMQTLINDIKNSMPATCLFQAWSGALPGGWAISGMSNVVAAMNDPYVKVRENLGRP